jgi:hypothetical protein
MFEIRTERIVSFHVKCSLILSKFYKIRMCPKMFVKLSNIMLYENPFRRTYRRLSKSARNLNYNIRVPGGRPNTEYSDRTHEGRVR